VIPTGFGGWSINTAFVKELAIENRVDDYFTFLDKVTAVVAAYSETLQEEKEE